MNEVESFEQYAIEIAKKLAEETTRHHPDGFTQAEKLVMEHIKEWSKAFKEHMECKSEESKTRMRNTRAKLQTTKRRVKHIYGNDTLLTSANAKASRQTQKVHGTLFSN